MSDSLTQPKAALGTIALLANLVALSCALLGCGAASESADRALYLTALDSGDCAAVKSANLQDDCWLAWAAKPLERKAPGPQTPERANAVSQRVADTCAHVNAQRARAECYFLIAEKTGTPELCAQAGTFKDDCGLHAVSMAFAQNRALTEPWAYEQIVASGMNPDDLRPWSAYFREVLSRSSPLDRSACTSVADLEGAPPATARIEACTQTGRALFEDRLNQARDQRRFTCVGNIVQLPVPERVTWAPDAELDAIFARRTDLCTPMHAPSGGPR